jgi:predicted transglutaminase-like cysteine proteinase
MRRIAKIFGFATLTLAMFWGQVSKATVFQSPVAYVLPPIGYSRFCLNYPDDCRVHGIDFRLRNIALTPDRWNELNTVNQQVNRHIAPEVTSGDGLTEQWLIAPLAGDCKDYAITKRHELLVRGWPSRALLLLEVVISDGEHHLVLVVRTKDMDLVLDNLDDDVRLVAMAYRQNQRVRIESPQNPSLWTMTVSALGASQAPAAPH